MTATPSPAPDRPRLLQIADVFARYGNFTLGGGSATVAVMHREILDKRHWVSGDQFNMSFALARLTPGTNLLAFGAGIGWLLRGFLGAVIALLAGSIPCTAMVIFATALFHHWQDNSWAQAAIHGAVAAAVGITAKSSWTIAGPYFKGKARPRVAIIGLAAFALYVFGGFSPIAVLLGAAVIGAFLPPVTP